MRFVTAIIAAVVLGLSANAETINFDEVKPGQVPPGWQQGVTGAGTSSWSVEPDTNAPSKPNALKQSAYGQYAWCVYRDVALTDGFVEVKFKPIAGQEDQAGGVIWRFKDGLTYYVARANALENNVTIYHTTHGQRVAFKKKKAEVKSNEWHTLRVDFRGKKFTVAFDGKRIMEVEDGTIQGGGNLGLWTKADSVTCFDDFAYGAQ
jgi:hypothetical protein